MNDSRRLEHAPLAQPTLLLLIFLGRVCGCTATAVDGWRVGAVMSVDMTADCTETNDCFL